MSNLIRLATMKKLIRKSGATRISNESCIALGIVLEEIGLKIADLSITFAEHSGRKTIKAKDIETATQRIIGF